MFKNYLKLALKVLLRRKLFTFITLFGIFFTLTIILAITAMYTSLIVYNPVEKDLSRTLQLRYITFLNDNTVNTGPSMPYLIESCVKNLNHVEKMSVRGSYSEPVTTYIQNRRLDFDMTPTDENFWKLLSFTFLEGRPYSKTEIEQGQKLVVISNQLKRQCFGDSTAIGKSIVVKNETYKVIGVVKDIPKIYDLAYAQLWKPYNYNKYQTEVKKKVYESWSYTVILVARHKSDFEAIKKQFAQSLKAIKPTSDFKSIEAKLETPFDVQFGEFLYPPDFQNAGETYMSHTARISLLIGILILFLSLPLLNLTNLTISRIYERSSEIGVRKAFGATRRQLMIQFVYENLLVSLIGGILGFIGAVLLLKGISESGLASVGDVQFSFPIFIYGMIIIIIFGVVSGLYPALRMSKMQIAETMKGGKQ